MLEDLTGAEAKRDENERHRIAEEARHDQQLLNALAAYTPLLDSFCGESGWQLQRKGIGVVSPHGRFGTGPAQRCLHVFLEGPLKRYSPREYDFSKRDGMNLFIWHEDRGFLRTRKILLCATTCTLTSDHGSDAHTSWESINSAKMTNSLRAAFMSFGSRKPD